MRTIWLAVVGVLLAAGLTAHGQQLTTRKKPSNSSGNWAVNQAQYSDGQPQAPPVSVPGYASPVLPPGGPPVQPVPHGPVGSVLPHGGPPHSCGCDGGCAGDGHGRPKHGLLPWLCYRPLKGCQKYPCGPCCRVPLIYYFCGCKEGYTFTTVPPCCGCPRPDIWSKIYAAGHHQSGKPAGCGAEE